LIDVAYLDEAGFSMTLPVSYSLYPINERLCLPFEASQGRRVNALGAYFSHGPCAGRFEYQTWASLPAHARNAKRKTAEQVAQDYGLSLEEIGPIDSARLLDFVWRIADRPQEAASDWKRERPLMIVLDNYSVHKSACVKEAVGVLEAADIYLVYLPSYSPELSKIEPIWNDVKQHYLPTRSYEQVVALKRATESALERKAANLRQAHSETTNFQRLAA
jgi:putative transposase